MKSSLRSYAENLWKNALAVITKDRDSYYKFGDDDRLPNQIVEVVNSSGTARLCVTRLKQFTKAHGLVNKDLGKKRINNSQTANDLIGELALNISYFPAVIARVVYANDGTPARLYGVQMQKIRRQGSRFVYNECFGEKEFKKSENIYLNEFEPITESTSDEDRAAIITRRQKTIFDQTKKHGKQYGDILFVFEKGVGKYYDVYPIPDYFSGIEDIKSDAQISTLENRNISKGFRTPVIISTGPIDDVNKDENGLTDQDKFDLNIQQFTGEKAASVLHLQGETNEQKPAVTTINIAEILDQTDKVTDRIGRKVCRLFTVPPVIAGFATAGQLGQNQELKNSMDLFRLTVSNNQGMISSALNMVWPDQDWTISTLQLFDFLPDSVLNRLTDAEVRELFGLKPAPTTEVNPNPGSDATA